MRKNGKSKLHKLPIIGNFVNKLDRDAKTLGFQKAMRNAVKGTGTELIVKGINNKLEKLLKSKPVIIVANHPYEMEILALIAAIPERDNAYIIMNADFLGICPSLDKHVIPVYIKHHHIGNITQKLSAKMLDIFHPSEKLTPEEEHKKNIDSINVASWKVQVGALVAVFPGAKSENGRWHAGLGHLIKNIKDISNIYIVQVYIKGTTALDYLRLVPYMSKVFPKVSVTFSEPYKLNNWINHEDSARKIVADMEEHYDKWMREISS